VAVLSLVLANAIISLSNADFTFCKSAAGAMSSALENALTFLINCVLKSLVKLKSVGVDNSALKLFNSSVNCLFAVAPNLFCFSKRLSISLIALLLGKSPNSSRLLIASSLIIPALSSVLAVFLFKDLTNESAKGVSMSMLSAKELTASILALCWDGSSYDRLRRK